MEKQERRLQLLENFIYLVIWAVVLVMPLWNIDQLENTSEVDWEPAFHAWKMICPLLILFLVNNYILLPFLLIRKKSWLYLLFTICAIGLTIICCIKNMPGQEIPDNRPPRENRNQEQAQGQRPPMPPKRMQRSDPQIPDHRLKQDNQPNQGSFRLPPFIAPHFLIVILIIGVNMAIKFLFKSIRDDHRMKSLEKQTFEVELAYLKHQINPHFFMNTLNNIHALIDIDKEKAQKTVLELSKIMRYVLYDTSLPSVSLDKEIHFLSNYIELMKIRYTEQVDIRISLPGEIPNTQIPPLLFISFLENAFKHGISYKNKSFIHLSMEIKETELHCLIINSYCHTKKIGETGIGLENTRKRLRLLYDTNYTLHIENKDDQYHVLLIIPIQL